MKVHVINCTTLTTIPTLLCFALAHSVTRKAFLHSVMQQKCVAIEVFVSILHVVLPLMRDILSGWMKVNSRSKTISNSYILIPFFDRVNLLSFSSCFALCLTPCDFRKFVVKFASPCLCSEFFFSLAAVDNILLSTAGQPSASHCGFSNTPLPG